MKEFPCHNGEVGKIVGYRKVCTQCGSFFDCSLSKSEYRYDNSYGLSRKHFDPEIGRLKVRSLERWLSKISVNLSEKAVCEVGFGGGFTLKYLFEEAKLTYGIEVSEANFENAAKIGIPPSNLLDARVLPETLETKIDFWLFSDSFEHIPDPESFMSWVLQNSSTKAKLMLVLPRAGSLSEKFMGRLWPHKLPDHIFHWSRKGLMTFMQARGVRCQCEFFPVKYVSVFMILRHICHKLSLSIEITHNKLTSVSFPFNFGEMGLLFEIEANEESDQ